MSGTDRLQYIQRALEAGTTYADMGRHLGISRERVRQIVNKHFDVSMYPRICPWCGKPVDGGNRHVVYHKECFPEAHKRQSREKAHAKTWHQRMTFSHAEALAMTTYRERDIPFVACPYQAPFDFWLSGIRVRVSGSRLNAQGCFQWRIARQAWSDVTDACDVMHLVGMREQATHHLIVPASEAVGISTIVWRPWDSEHKGSSQWDRWVDAWSVLEAPEALQR